MAQIPKLPKLGRRGAREVFAKLDRDDDGRIERAELMAAHRIPSRNPGAPTGDRNADGALSRNEYYALLKKKGAYQPNKAESKTSILEGVQAKRRVYKLGSGQSATFRTHPPQRGDGLHIGAGSWVIARPACAASPPSSFSPPSSRSAASSRRRSRPTG